MGMGIPVLHGVEGESADIVMREDVGLVFEPENADDLGRKLQALSTDQTLADRLRANGPVAARRYDRSALAGQMLEHLQRAAAQAAWEPSIAKGKI
jgi:hypothetical protein